MSEREEIISVVLMPDDEFIGKFRNISARIPNSLFYLDDTKIPHITLAQFRASFTELPKLAEDIKDLKGLTLELVASGLNFVPDTKRQEMWVEVSVLKSSALNDVQQKILTTDFAQKHELHSGARDLYRPHITIGLLEGVQSIPAVAVTDIADFLRTSFRATIFVGKNGEYFSFQGES